MNFEQRNRQRYVRSDSIRATRNHKVRLFVDFTKTKGVQQY